MASTKTIEQKRKTTSNIHKITRTMELVATAKLKLAKRHYAEFMLYRDNTFAIFQSMALASDAHDLMKERAAKKVIIVVIASNKGLCGSYNTHLVESALALQKKLTTEKKTALLYVVGRKAISYLKFHEIEIAKAYENFPDQPKFLQIENLGQELMSLYNEHTIDQIWLLYSQKLKITQQLLLPFSLPTKEESQLKWDYAYSPSQSSVLEHLLPMCVNLKLFGAFLDASVSEQTSRMLAMKTATENAEKMIKQLTQKYNRARQAQITQEILEILAGAETR